jgi:hypothetical protein
MAVVSALGLGQALEAEGFQLPKYCREVRLVAGVEGSMVLQYEVLVTDDDAIRLGRALQRLGERK